MDKDSGTEIPKEAIFIPLAAIREDLLTPEIGGDSNRTTGDASSGAIVLPAIERATLEIKGGEGPSVALMTNE